MNLDTITIFAILIGGGWTFYHFVITRARHPKLEFDLELKILGKSDKHYVLELAALISNKGLTRQHIHNFTFNILTCSDDLPLKTNADIRYQLDFEPRCVDMDWVNPDHHQFVDGGVSRRFTHVTIMPVPIRYVMLYAKFHDIETSVAPVPKNNPRDISLDPLDKVLMSPRPKNKPIKKTHHKYHISRTFALNEDVSVLKGNQR